MGLDSTWVMTPSSSEPKVFEVTVESYAGGVVQQVPNGLAPIHDMVCIELLKHLPELAEVVVRPPRPAPGADHPPTLLVLPSHELKSGTFLLSRQAVLDVLYEVR